MKIRFATALLLAAALLASCAGQNQVGVLTRPTPSVTNLPGHDYPMVNPDLSAVFRVDFPDAKAVAVGVGGKNYDMARGADGLWEVTTEPIVPGFHYYMLTVDGKRVPDPNTHQR